MTTKKLTFRQKILVAGTLFGMFFGAGNLIFPPMLGLQSGSNWLSGMIGMLASGVGLPILAIIVLGMCGSVQKISDHVNKKFYTVMIGAIMILCCCGTFGVVVKTGAFHAGIGTILKKLKGKEILLFQLL